MELRAKVIEADPILPQRQAKRETCLRHIKDGRGDEMFREFVLAGCVIEPGAIKEASETGGCEFDLSLQLSCPGESIARHVCRLTLTQHDQAGNQVAQAKW